MAKTTSWAFPNMIDPSRNKVQIVEDDASVVNRVRLLMLSDPTELYNEPQFGLGLKRYLWQYNNANTLAIIQSKIIEQLTLFEPSVEPESTSFADGLLFTGEENIPSSQEYNQLKMTVGLHTIYGDELNVNLNTDTQE